LDFFQHKCYLNARVPRVKNADGKVTLQQVPWARKNSGFTLLFEAYAMLLIENEMPVSKAAKLVRVNPQRLWSVFDYWVSIAHNEDVIAPLKGIGFDETSTKKGHNYVTLMVDMNERRVLFATEGKGADTIKQSVEYLNTSLYYSRLESYLKTFTINDFLFLQFENLVDSPQKLMLSIYYFLGLPDFQHAGFKNFIKHHLLKKKNFQKKRIKVS
jgi:hypothetical protein